MSYGMTAYYSEASTEEYPIIQISSNYGGEKKVYDVHVKDIDPRNASQLEMFALSCYLDEQGITNGGTFGSYSRMKAYAANAAYLKYGIDLQDPANASAFESWSEGDIGKEPIDYQKILQEKISEISAKIRNGDTEQTYQIGGQSFTEKEWEELLENFDSIEDLIRELMREEQKQKEAEQLQKNTITQEESTMLVSESTRCSYPTNNPDDEDVQYITWYTEEGIFCSRAGQTEGYEWTVPFESKEQYDEVMRFIDTFPSDWNFRFAAHENFWKDFLNETTDVLKADYEGKSADINSNEVQKTWLSNAMPLPEGIGLTGKEMITFLESKAAPIIYNFEELYNQFGIEIQWEYENGYPVRGIVENSAANHRAFIQMKAYMDKIAIQQIEAGNRFVTHPNSVLYEGLNV